MNEPDEPFVERISDVLDEHARSLPPGVASRLAAARADALAQRSARSRWAPVGYGAFATAAVLLVAIALDRDEGAAPLRRQLPEALQPVAQRLLLVR